MGNMTDVNDFLKDYLGDPLEDYTKEQIMDAIQEYLIDKGYGREQTIATILYVTNGGQGVDFSGYLDVKKDSKFAAKLADIDVAKIYSYYASVATFAPDIYSLYNNLNDIEQYRNEDGSYTSEGKERLEESLYSFLSISGSLIELVPGGFIYSSIFTALPDYIGTAIEAGTKHNETIYAIDFLINHGLLDESWENWAYGDWENGPTLEELEEIYNSDIDTDYPEGDDILNEYLEWRIQYEFEQKLISNGIDPEYYYTLVQDSQPGWFEESLDSIKNFFGWLGDGLTSFADGWVDFWKGVGSNLYDFVQQWNKFWGDIGAALYDKLIETTIDIINTVEAWNTYWNLMGDHIRGEVEKIFDGAELITRAIGNQINNYFNSMEGRITAAWDIWVEFWQDIGHSLQDFITEGMYKMIIGSIIGDSLTGNSQKDLIIAGAGNDTVSGDLGDDLIYGGAGDDILYGNDGEDLLYGGVGNDKLIGGVGNDELYGGEGDDILFGDNEVSLLRALKMDDAITNDDIVHGGDGNDTLYGGQSNDKLFGDADNDELHGGEGNDELFGGDGDDTLYGDAGNDYLEDLTGNNHLYGGEGDDTLVSGDGTDYMYGGSGNDYFIGGDGENHMYGEDGDDRLQGGEGYDYMDGGIGNDILSGGNGDNEMYGQDGNDQIYGGNDNDYIDGGVGDDELYGGNGNNTIYGGDGNDIIYDGDDGSHIYGGTGNDTIRAGGGNDVIDAGEGDDYIQDDHGDDTIIFKAGYGTDTISDAAGNNAIELSGLSIENAIMSRINGSDLEISFGADNIIIKQYFDGAGFQNFNIKGTMLNALITTLHGSDQDDWLSAWSDNGVTMNGEGGNDTLNGGNGDDALEGGTGNDFLYGNSGNDTYIFSKGSGNDTIEDWNGSSFVKLTDINIDEISISKMNDSTLILTIDSTGDTLTVNGYKWNQGGYTFEFADGTTDSINKDTWKWESGFGSTAEEDTPPEQNIMNGTSGNDNIYGTDGNDIIDGSTGNDILYGGNGEDTYIFAKGYGSDTVNEWSSDHSVIQLTDINSDEVTITDQWGSNLILSVSGTEDTLTISNFKWGQSSYTFEFADGVTGTVNKDTWALELDIQETTATTPESEETIVQNNADLLAGIYKNDTETSALFSETDDTVIADATEASAIITNEETDVISEQTDVQTIVLIDAMAGFAAESNISDTNANLADTADSTIMNQLLVGTQVQ